MVDQGRLNFVVPGLARSPALVRFGFAVFRSISRFGPMFGNVSK